MMIANGKQSIYEQFDMWREMAKLEAEYKPGKFFEIYYSKTLSDLEEMEFFSNYALWQLCSFNRQSIMLVEGKLQGPDDE